MFLEQGRRGEPRPCKQMTVALSADGQGRRCGGGGMGRGEGPQRLGLRSGFTSVEWRH